MYYKTINESIIVCTTTKYVLLLARQIVDTSKVFIVVLKQHISLCMGLASILKLLQTQILSCLQFREHKFQFMLSTGVV